MTRLIALFFVLVSSPPELWAAVVCGTATTDSTSAADPSTLAYTPDAGADRVVLVHVAIRDSDANNAVVNGVTSSAGGTWTLYGSTTEESSTADIGSYVFYSTDFADGAQTLTADYSGALLTGFMAAYTCTGVRTASPFRGAATTSGASTNATSVSIDIASAVNDLVVDFVNVGSLNAGLSPTIGAGQTQIYNAASGGDNLDSMSSSEPGINGNVTMSWSAGTTEAWASVGGSLVPATAVSFGPLRRRD
jgi:hypothetical protein